MASVAAANPKSVDESLWWDSFVDLIDELENASLFTELPPSLVKKLKSNHVWFLDTVSLFKPPNEKSRVALDSQQISIGSHRLVVEPKLKNVALQVSECSGLDEVQSYILVKRLAERDNVVEDVQAPEFVHMILLQYYVERQCLLKCTRQIIMHALCMRNGCRGTDAVGDEASKLISGGLEKKLLSVLQDLLSSKHPDHMEVDLATLWAEETLIEDNLVLDILFLAYYESFCTCNGEQWKKLCSLYKGILSGSFNFGMLAISGEARSSFYHSKVQILLILIETLNLENLLQMVHDEVPFRQGNAIFSLKDIQEMDAIVSTFNASEMEEAGPLVLAWAVFLCLVSSLPEKQECNLLADMDHVGYVRQAFEASPLKYFLDILQNDLLKDLDGPVAGYRSVIRTFISAFIASYEITLQLGDDTLNLILDVLCSIYRGEESLCDQFWDKDSFIDGPVRCLLCTLEGEFPYRVVEFVRFLSALCEGTWPAECVYNFLDKSVGISSLYTIADDACIEDISQIIQTPRPLYVPGIEDLLIPSQTRGYILKFVDGNSALVRWEYMQSGVFVLLLRLAREYYSIKHEEIIAILDLICRMVSYNTAVCFALMNIDNSLQVETARKNGHMEKSMKVDVVEIICTLFRNLCPNVSGAAVMSMSVSILVKLLKCSPSHVIAVVLKKNIFDVAFQTKDYNTGGNGSSSGMWLLSGGFARMLLLDCEHNQQSEDCCMLTISVLDFAMQLVELGAEDDIVLALVVFSLQYVLVNHEYWKYKVKHVRWKVTLKVLDLMKKCILLIPCSQKLGGAIRDILLYDSSIHNTLCRIMCISTQTLESLYVSRLYEVKEIEGLQHAVCSVLEVVSLMLSAFSKDAVSSLPAFHQVMLSSSTKPIPVVTAAMSLITYFREPGIQIGAARVLSMLCELAEHAQPYLFGSVSLVSDDLQIRDIRDYVYEILSEETPRSEDLFVAVMQMLTSAARYQPAFLVSVMATKGSVEVQDSGDVKNRTPLGALLQYVRRSQELIKRDPHLLVYVLRFLQVLWQETTHYLQILELLRRDGMFWKQLSSVVSLFATKKAISLDSMSGDETTCLAYRYQCHAAVLEIMAYDLFLQKKELQAQLLVKQTVELSKVGNENKASAEKSVSACESALKDFLSAWCKSSIMGDLINSYVSCEYDSGILLRAKTAAGLFMVHVMSKLTVGDSGSLSIYLLKKIDDISKKLSEQPSFSELRAQYSSRGYSEGKQVDSLILSDLYFHLQGELEGREINPGPFKELSEWLLDFNVFHADEYKSKIEFSAQVSDACLFDLAQLQADMGLEFWNHSDWKSAKTVADKMLLYMKNANSMSQLANSKLSALKALTIIIAVHGENLSGLTTALVSGEIPKPTVEVCIEHICKSLMRTSASLVPYIDASRDILDFFAAQAELLNHHLRILLKNSNKKLPEPMRNLLLKSVGACLRLLSSMRPSVVGLKRTIKLFLMVLLPSVQLCCPSSSVEEKPDLVSTEVSLLSLGLLPVLCNFIGDSEYCTLSLATMDLILKFFLAADTWLPVIGKHLRLQIVIQKLTEKDSLVFAPMVLRFLLTLARVRGGAEMLQMSSFFSSLKVMFALSMEGTSFLDIQDEGILSTSCDKNEKPQHIWGLGLAVVTAMINSLGDGSCIDFVDKAIPYFSENAHLVFYYLSAPDFPSDGHERKRARTQKAQTSLTALREMEQTLMLICVLAKYRNPWARAMKETDSQLRERSIHLLASISRGTQRIGDSPSRTAPLLCPPILKEEIECNGSPSFVNSRHGWFALMPLGCASQSKVSSASSTAMVPFTHQPTKNVVSLPQTRFSDAAAIQIYKIAFLLLRFLCLQAKGAARRAEEVGFIDLASFPELPMPEILHGLQDQAISITTELCQASKSKNMEREVKDVCLLLFQIMEKALYLELCVSQTCGIRPVLGRVEDFSKEIKLLIEAAEQHAYLKASVKSLIQIISLVYPGLLQN